ncbi:MAG: hypothetical protein RPU42_11170 [Candidatus Sedimenticola sp. (ex Thyasira tokunagai)]
MAIYDRDAAAAGAVTAFLAQFKVASTGAITYVSGSDTFHVWWLHRALQKIAWDFTISGDDEINLTKPNPSTSEALGTIITLLNHTTDYSVNYTITDTVAEYLFGGSVEQNDGDDGYYGLKVQGQTATATPLKLIQDHTELTSHWGTGKNQTDSNTLLRILVKGRTGGADIDNKVAHVKASKWYDTFAVWGVVLGLGEASAAIITSNDPQNTTLLATVQGYGISKSEGYKLIDVDGAGDKVFLGEWSHSALGKKALSEFVKAILVDGSTDTLYGVDGDLWTGRVYDCVIGSGSGTWVQNETLSWGSGATAGTGNLMAVDDTDGTATARLVLHLNTGVFPDNTLTVTGAGAATGVISGTPSKITTDPNHLGLYTGSNWIGAYGIGIIANELTFGDSVTSLDGETPTVPQNVTATVTVETGLAGDEPHVFLAEKDGVLNAPDYTTNTIGTGNNSSDPDLVMGSAIASDIPQDGWIMVLDTTGGAVTYKPYHHSSWAGSTYTLDVTDHPGGLDENLTNGDDAFEAILYDSATGGGTTKTISNTYVYSADKDVIGWVRHGDPDAPDKPVPISGTITSAGLSITVVLDDES